MAVLIGQTTAGTTATFCSQGALCAWKFTASASGDVATLHIESKVANAGMSDLHLAIYSDDTGFSPTRPLTLLGYGTSTAASQPSTEVEVTLGSPVTVVSGTAYHLAILPEGGSQGFDYQGTNANTAIADNGGAGYSLPPGTWAHTTNFSDAGPAFWGEDSGAVWPPGDTPPGPPLRVVRSNLRLG